MVERIAILKDLTMRYPPKEALRKLPDQFFENTNSIVLLGKEFFQDIINTSKNISIEFGDNVPLKPGYLTLLEFSHDTLTVDLKECLIACEIIGLYTRERSGVSYVTIHLLNQDSSN